MTPQLRWQKVQLEIKYFSQLCFSQVVSSDCIYNNSMWIYKINTMWTVGFTNNVAFYLQFKQLALVWNEGKEKDQRWSIVFEPTSRSIIFEGNINVWQWYSKKFYWHLRTGPVYLDSASPPLEWRAVCFSLWWPGERLRVHLSADMHACNLMLQSHGELDYWQSIRTGRNTRRRRPEARSTRVSRDQQHQRGRFRKMFRGAEQYIPPTAAWF